METTIHKMLETLDPYTKYIPESDVERFQMMTKGEYGGVGALIGPRDSSMMVAEIFKGFPADSAGLLPGDIIVSIDRRSIVALSNEDVHELLKGQAGTTLNIEVKRKNSNNVLPFSIKREKISVKSVPFYGMISKNIGYIKLKSFTQGCALEVKTAYINLQKQGAKSFVLDLRDNPGGLLFEAIQLTNIFVDKGEKIVFTKGQNTVSEQSFFTKEPVYDSKSKIIVLVNDRSASASEIVSGALQDMDRAVVIGNQTFGKGLVQTRKELAHNTMLKITNSKYYIPSGRCIQKIDYSNKDKNGKVHEVADSLTSVFYTKNGRPVKDGGGVIPDVIIENEKYTDFQKALKNEQVFLDYVCLNITKSDTASFSTKENPVSESLYKNFIEFVQTQDFAYTSEAEKSINTIKEKAKQENLAVDSLIFLLEQNINKQQEKLYASEKKEIAQLLAEEIIQYLFYEEGVCEYKLLDDSYVKCAIKHLEQDNLYSNILTGLSGTHKKQ